ncbi:MAG: DUF1080 domain-containing protein [Xanthomonadales bacterium]|jgi:hypothetical protein|nr:DUF1080 domain-containing protein [Xanthomonadales bacterium]
MTKKTQFKFTLIVLAGLLSGAVQAAEWRALFNGADLDGWEQVNGTARYEVEGDAIVGYTVMDSPNSFLATKERFSDFILEYDMYVDPAMNSGVQIRSHQKNGDGIVFGYQIEVDPTDRRFTGGFYDEKRRKWLYPLSLNEKGRDAFKNGQWNHFRVEAIGNSFQVWVNGIQTAAVIDEMDDEGFIALQVHSIKDPAFAGRTVRWRNMRILTDDLEANRTPRDPEVRELSFLNNQLSDYEVRQGWRLLWDGKTTEGWRGAKLDHFPESGWTIEDGALTVAETEGKESAGPGDIVTLDSFANFEFSFEFKITEGANSGIKYFVDPELNKGEGSAIGCEFQILDDKVHPDAKKGVAGNRTLGSLYDLITAENYSLEGRAKQFKGIGNWNQGRIVSHNGRVEHWLNGEKVVEFDRHSQMFRALVAYSKYQVWPGFCQWPEGSLLLQDHGNEVSYRNLKVREW